MDKKGIFDNPKNIKILLAILYLLCFLTLIADFFIHKHTYFDWEKWPLFYGVYGFMSYVGLVFVAKYLIRPLIMRKEDFYDD